MQRFLDTLSIQFGSIDDAFSAMQIIHPLKEFPIIVHDGRYLCPSISLLDYAVERHFTKFLMQDKPKFSSKRHDFVLDKGLELLQKVLVGSKAYSKLSYNDGNNGEMDGLLLYDKYAFFIEVKGNAISDKAKSGNHNRIMDHIDRLIEDSHQQATRADRYLRSSPSAEFRDGRGNSLIIGSANIKHSFHISLTLEPISNIAGHIKGVNNLNLFTDGKFPWIVNLYDLMVICDFLDTPSFLIHFLIRRNFFLNIREMRITDELDLLGYYLQNGLHFDQMIADNSDVGWYQFQSLNQQFNDYYFHQAGLIKGPVVKPGHYAQKQVQALVRKLDGMQLMENRTEFAIALLSLNTDAQKQFVKSLIKSKEDYKKYRDVHDFSLTGNHNGQKWGIISFCLENIVGKRPWI